MESLLDVVQQRDRDDVEPARAAPGCAPAAPEGPASVSALQRSAGNQAVNRLLGQRDASPVDGAVGPGVLSLSRSVRAALSRCAPGATPGSPGECAECRSERLEHAEEDDRTAGALALASRERATLSRVDGGTPDAGTAAPASPAAGTPDAGAAPQAPCALTTFTGSNFVGDAVVADTEFVDSLQSIDTHAAAANVNVHVTSSFRQTAVVPGAIVQPAQMSNHMAGHAIDMNVLHGANKGTWCNSGCLGGANRPAPVETFIQAIRGDSGLRWGGDFSDADPVHIDDNLNADTAAWTARRDAVQAARTAGCG